MGLFFHCFHKFTLVKQITVEPIAILLFLSTQLFFVTLQAGTYQVVCYQLYNDPSAPKHANFTVDCKSRSLPLDVQNAIQRKMVTWTMIMALSQFLTSLVSSCFLGAMGDVYGRKPNILLSLAGILICTAASPVIFEFKNLSLWFLAFTNMIGSSFGHLGLAILSCYAYLCDRILDKKDISIRMTMFTALTQVAGILGSLVSGVLLGRITPSRMFIIIECLMTTAFFYTLIFLDSLTPVQMRQKMILDRQKSSSISIRMPEISKKSTTNMKEQKCADQFLKDELRNVLKNILHTYTKRRPNHDRAFLFVTSLILFLHMMADLGLLNAVVANYVFRHPFNWTDGSQLGYWKAAKGFMTFTGNVGGILIFKKVLKMRDTSIMLISVASIFVELIIIAFSYASWMLYVAVAVGSFSNLVMPVVGSFVSQIVQYDEIGKSFTMHGVAASLSFVCSTTLFNYIYNFTLEYMPGFVFLFGAFVMFVSFLIILWMHLMISRKDVLPKNAENK